MRTRSLGPPPPAHSDALLLRTVGFAALLVGCYAAWLYHDAGLTLSHYDTKGHLVVARRVIDNLTPGWRQLGAVWLPLPHVLNLLPVQIDAFYRTGASAVAISVAAFAAAALFVARIVLRAGGSRVVAVAAAAVFTLNPDLLYLQSTPMTEPLLVALLVIATSFAWDWLQELTRDGIGDQGSGEDGATRLGHNADTAAAARRRVSSRRLGWTLAAACLTRYEAWPFTCALLVLALLALWRGGLSLSAAAGRVGRVAIYPVTVVALFLINSRLTVGRWLVTDGFFVPDNIDTGKPLHAVASVWWGAHVIAGYGVLAAATAGVVAILAAVARNRRRAPQLAFIALFAVGTLPAYAFYDGHPFRIRYMTPLVPALAVCAAIAAVSLRGWSRHLAAAALVLVAIVETHPFDFRAPMLLEAQWDSGNAAARRQITRYLAARYDGQTVMASMQSLAHYMQELSSAGFNLRNFLHEGNGDLWQAALEKPRAHVGWILIEEWAEDGDALARLARRDPNFLAGFTRVAEGGGVALYRRQATGSGEQATGEPGDHEKVASSE